MASHWSSIVDSLAAASIIALICLPIFLYWKYKEKAEPPNIILFIVPPVLGFIFVFIIITFFYPQKEPDAVIPPKEQSVSVVPPCMDQAHFDGAVDRAVLGLRDFIAECKNSGSDFMRKAYDSLDKLLFTVDVACTESQPVCGAEGSSQCIDDYHDNIKRIENPYSDNYDRLTALVIWIRPGGLIV